MTYLEPVWRFEPNPNAAHTASIALDPMEAEWVLDHGAKINGKQYRASLQGWGPEPDMEGRVTVRLEIAE